MGGQGWAKRKWEVVLRGCTLPVWPDEKVQGWSLEAQAWNPSTWGAKVGGPRVQDPELGDA